MVDAIDDVEPLACQGGIQASLNISEILISLDCLGVYDAILDSIWKIFIGGLSTSTFRELAGLRLRLLLVCDLRLGEGNLRVRS